MSWGYQDSILALDLHAIEIEIYSESHNGIEYEFPCRIDHGPDWNVEFSIPIQTPYKHFSNFWGLKISDFTKQNFLIKVRLWLIN